MFRREIRIIFLVTSAIFISIAGISWFAVRQIHVTSAQLVKDTMPGLMDVGMATERMHENRHTMRMMLDASNISRREAMTAQIQTNSTEALWKEYANSIYEKEDDQNFRAMMVARQEYRAGCQQYYDLLVAGKFSEASEFFDGKLSQLFNRYKATVKILFDYNAQQGEVRGKKIVKSLRYGPIVFAGLTVFVFLIGFLFGLRCQLSGPGTTSKRRPKP